MKPAIKLRHTLIVTCFAAMLGLAATTNAAIPSNPEAATKGVFGPLIKWPVMPIHLLLLPDGRILSYGVRQGDGPTGLVHDVWNPALGTGANSHSTMQNVVNTNLFCAGMSMISATNEALITGGEIGINGVSNNGVSDANFFNFQTNKLRPASKMAFKRWYPTVTTLSDGSALITGGRDDAVIPTFAATPELYVPGVGFRSLTAAFSDDAYGKIRDAWYYPRAFLAPNGKVFIINNAGKAYWLNSSKLGTLSQIPNISAPAGYASLPSAMYWPGKVFSIRAAKQVALFDVRTTNVTMKMIPGLSHNRLSASATLMADGKLFINGGSNVYNKLIGVSHQAEIWNPADEKFTLAASNDPNIARLYHSDALLLPDATIITGGGGFPGPQTNLNAEIYYPPYLYKKDGSGTAAARPTITNVPATLTWGQTFNLSYTSSTPISRITLIRAGSATHDLNVEQRYNTMPFTQANANTVSVTGPKFKTTSPPGYYMVFIFDQNGVPSVAKIIHLK